VLIANRGEITRRVIKSCKKMGVKTVAIYSDADMNSMFVKEADEAYRIGPPPTKDSYLRMDIILDVIKSCGAQAVHPGYGFLSENSKFQKLLQENKVKFIGPPTRAIEAMGDKIESKKLARDAKVSTIPGYLGEVNGDEEVLKIARQIGYPVMIKASAGGGGKGMRIAFNDKEAIEGFKLSREEAISSFGDGRIFIEKYIQEPRHIEFQILGDEHGNYVYMPERECSVQRRNQKVIEEAPCSVMDPTVRKRMGEQALSLARACGYQSTGTCEFLMDKNKDFYFLEMNTRLQVEHPITEEITGIDLVEQQLLIAAGYPLAFKQQDVKINGHAVEYRVYAEDPSRKFLPSIGFLRKYKEPTPHENIRIDTGVMEGSEISMYYDPMISKLIAWGKDRKSAMSLLGKAMDEYVIRGVVHNVGFGRSILRNQAFAEGKYSTAFIPTYYPQGFKGDPLDLDDHHQLVLAAHHLKNWKQTHVPLAGEEKPAAKNVWYSTLKIQDKDTDYKVEKRADGSWIVTDIAAKKSTTVKASDFILDYGSLLRFKYNGNESLVQYLDVKEELHYNFYYKGNTVDVTMFDETQFPLKKFMAPPKKIDYAKSVLSPMPGAIVSVAVTPGQTVTDGQELFVIEAMKMQNMIKS
jgi:propionyl-CoA carboxylase alpha chain